MNKFKLISNLFGALTIILLCTMCSVVSYQYCSILCNELHCGGSAPPEIAFLYSIPFIVVSAITLLLHLLFKKKAE